MNVFDLNRHTIDAWKPFSRSFATIAADDLRGAVDLAYAEGKFTPPALVSMNPRYEEGPSVDDLVDKGTIHAHTARIFRVHGEPIRLHRHQRDALALAEHGESFVVTTGTGSGKSLCFFLPIIDRVVRARAAGEPARTLAIVIYPMNALANSQLEEINKFLRDSGLKDPPRVARYTGQERGDDRTKFADSPPDILLTNFMMLELLLKRHDKDGSRVIENCGGLEFLVLDELHTYRGRQGADVAMLVRRLREALLPPAANLRCIGTSASMSSVEGVGSSKEVLDVARRLFAAEIGDGALVGESLRRATIGGWTRESLSGAIAARDTHRPDAELVHHPLVAWSEMSIGLEDEQGLSRRKPMTLNQATRQLALDSGCPEADCRVALEMVMVDVSLAENARGGTGEKAFLAFKLHQFVSGPENIFATVAKPGSRLTTLDAQQFHPETGDRLFETHFCRFCGQDYHPVRRDMSGMEFLPRSIDETPIDESDDVGFLMVEPEDLRFSGSPEDYPEAWVERMNDGSVRLIASRRAAAAQHVEVLASGQIGAGGVAA